MLRASDSIRPHFVDRARRDLKKLDPERRRRVNDTLTELKEKDFPAGCSRVRLAEGHYRLRCGTDRIVYRIDREGPVVVIIGHRNKVYERLKRRV